MMYDGKRYQRCTSKVWLANLEWENDPGTPVIGRVIPRGKPIPKNAVPTGGTWKTWEDREENGKLLGGWVDTGVPVYAVPLTNLVAGSNPVYAKDGKAYLVRAGYVYSRPYNIPEEWKTRSARKIKR